jgi:hypothetical protein
MTRQEQSRLIKLQAGSQPRRRTECPVSRVLKQKISITLLTG